ncbi:hypothetical protein MUK42_28660 [Musa troglodytarum]|uniref:Uncharacterized protein n=1 Tax=Musa troglodytarum TaxID=320322 RepID=A0A9E7FGN3_9LILI|nr:hypothetical protein MUK42_28660 [Musa troglodytarum]
MAEAVTAAQGDEVRLHKILWNFQTRERLWGPAIDGPIQSEICGPISQSDSTHPLALRFFQYSFAKAMKNPLREGLTWEHHVTCKTHVPALLCSLRIRKPRAPPNKDFYGPRIEKKPLFFESCGLIVAGAALMLLWTLTTSFPKKIQQATDEVREKAIHLVLRQCQSHLDAALVSSALRQRHRSRPLNRHQLHLARPSPPEVDVVYPQLRRPGHRQGFLCRVVVDVPDPVLRPSERAFLQALDHLPDRVRGGRGSVVADEFAPLGLDAADA